MRITRPPPRQPFETIIPLIDVVFYLLVFFMLIGRLDATAPFEVTPPTALTGADMPGGGATIAVSQTGALALDGVPFDRDALMARVTERLATDPALFFRVNAHHATELRNVLPLVAQLEAMGARDVALVVTPEDR